MNLELYIENLGAIEKAELSVNPLTILAGENGTGKSFVTKFLYSVLKVLNHNVLEIDFISKVRLLLNNFQVIQEFWEVEETHILKELIAFFKILNERVIVKDDLTDLIYSSEMVTTFNQLLTKYNKVSNEYIKLLNDDLIESEAKKIGDYGYIGFNSKKILTIQRLEKSSEILEEIKEILDKPEWSYFKALRYFLVGELKENFQISTIEQLIKNHRKKLVFEIKNIIVINIQKNDITISFSQFSNGKFININQLIFFESSVYWRLSPNILNKSYQDRSFFLPDDESNERLTGIPQHFLDLRDLVFTNFKHGERPAFIEECAEELQASLNGKFNSNGNDLAFETNQGQAISKNLVSFGMTNLGVLQAVLSKNIINKGSFVFIDEPESNLHPEWQAILAKILVKLAENGVFVVITTHSSDMLKALDVYTTQQQQENFISTNYFEKNGNLTFFSDDEIQNVGKLALVRNKLLEPYASLTFAKKGGFFDD